MSEANGDGPDGGSGGGSGIPGMSPEREQWLRFQAKKELRRRLRALRRALPKEARAERSARIVEGLLALPEWERARCVLAFVSMRDEVQLGALAEAAWASGKRLAAPAMSESFDELVLREWSEEEELEESGNMFLQPSKAAPPIRDHAVDLVIVPGLCFDAEGHRVGYGKGFYDRLLPRLVKAFRVGVAFDFQRIAEVPRTQGDVAVHAVLTDAGLDRLDLDRLDLDRKGQNR